MNLTVPFARQESHDAQESRSDDGVGGRRAGVGDLRGLAWATQGSGTTSSLTTRATFPGPLHVVREGARGWEVELEARPGLDLSTQAILFQPGGHSGWHSHPGPVLIPAVPGTTTCCEADPAANAAVTAVNVVLAPFEYPPLRPRRES